MFALNTSLPFPKNQIILSPPILMGLLGLALPMESMCIMVWTCECIVRAFTI